MTAITSVYLSSRYVQAAVGTAGAGGIRVRKLCDTLLPEGCLVNGVMTAEGPLTEALKAFWQKNALPVKNAALTINSTQFISKVVTVPTLPPKKMANIARRELAAMERRADAVFDYALLRRDKKAGTDTILASSVEATFLESCQHLAQSVGFRLSSIDTALGSTMQLLRLLPGLAEKTYILMLFDGDNATSVLMENGSYKYASRSRLFSARGTAELGSEVTQAISGVVQFQLAGKTKYAITDVYFAGCTPEDLQLCTAGCAMLGLRGAALPDGAPIALPEGWHLADCVYTVGNLIDR